MATLTYTTAELRALAGDTRPPPRSVRKTLFFFSDVLSSFDLVQHVSGSTHRRGNTLDVVMTFAD